MAQHGLRVAGEFDVLAEEVEIFRKYLRQGLIVTGQGVFLAEYPCLVGQDPVKLPPLQCLARRLAAERCRVESGQEAEPVSDLLRGVDDRREGSFVEQLAEFGQAFRRQFANAPEDVVEIPRVGRPGFTEEPQGELSRRKSPSLITFDALKATRSKTCRSAFSAAEDDPSLHG
ncbi:hypothetical protein ACFU53_12130 [Streptomyces sp. NPDC057474]|uniref:hypothetical protein n=1 Tax=Streptomyces sp. NPDC057474 TaxID=3346144 RepID=UPI0036888726